MFRKGNVRSEVIIKFWFLLARWASIIREVILLLKFSHGFLILSWNISISSYYLKLEEKLNWSSWSYGRFVFHRWDALTNLGINFKIFLNYCEKCASLLPWYLPHISSVQVKNILAKINRTSPKANGCLEKYNERNRFGIFWVVSFQADRRTPLDGLCIHSHQVFRSVRLSLL